MNLRNVKLIVAIAYVLTVALAAVASGASGPGLFVFTAVALMPAAALLRLWNHPSQTMSETIQAARR